MRLVKHHPAMRLVPELIEQWSWLDPKTLSVKIRDGVKFHSGEAEGAAGMACLRS